MNISTIGPSKRFFSGISAYTICLANALSEDNDVSALLLRCLLSVEREIKVFRKVLAD